MKKLILSWVTTLYILFFNIPLKNQAQSFLEEPIGNTSFISITQQVAGTFSPPSIQSQLLEKASAAKAPLSTIEVTPDSYVQTSCDESHPSPIKGSIPEPCHGQMLTYSVDANPDFTNYEWEMPRAVTGNPEKDWLIVSGQGTNSIMVRTGEKNGTIKLTVKHKRCSTKVQTLVVQPKEKCTGACALPAPELSGPEEVCFVYGGGQEGEPFMPYVYFVTNPVEGAVYDFILPEGFIQVGGEEGEPLIEVLTAFDLATEDASPSMTGIQQVISVVSYFPDQQCASKISSLFVTLTEENCEPGELLPVELAHFEGVSKKGAVELSWSTASERNNDRFEVQRSSNGKDFTNIGSVKGAGNSNTLLTYRYSDWQANAGTVYYRLNQVDTDKGQEYSKVIAVQHSTATTSRSLQIQVFPNPVTDGNFTVKVESLPKGAERIFCKVMDMNGKVVHTSTMPVNSREVNMALQSLGLRRGLYMVSFTAGAESYVQRLLIQ